MSPISPYALAMRVREGRDPLVRSRLARIGLRTYRPNIMHPLHPYPIFVDEFAP